MKDRKPDIIYSEPVKEIMGKPPGTIVRWGTIVMLLIFILFVIFTWLIRYPDTIPSPVEITTINPPVTLVSKITGHIMELKANDGDTVEVGELLALMETTASLEEINLIKKVIDTVTNPITIAADDLSNFTELGELQGYYASFLKTFSDMNSFMSNDSYGAKIRSLTEEINGMQEYLKRLREKEELYGDNLKLEQKAFNRYTDLFDSLAIAAAEYDMANQSLINSKMELQEVRLEIAAKSIEISEKQHALEENRIRQKEEEDKLASTLRESFLNFTSQLDTWESIYLLKSPVEGIVSYTNIWKENQLVTVGEPVLNIIPLDPGKFIGRINLKMQSSGKVDIDQQVIIKLFGYPYMEFGTVRGVVKSKSQVPFGDIYIIEIDLPYGLTSSYGENLVFTPMMQGTAEIMTKDIRLLQKIVNPFRYLAAKNKR